MLAIQSHAKPKIPKESVKLYSPEVKIEALQSSYIGFFGVFLGDGISFLVYSSVI